MVGGAEKDNGECWSQGASPRWLVSQPQSGNHMPVAHKLFTCHWLLPGGVECMGHGDRRGPGDRWGQASRDLLMWDPVITRGVELPEEPQVWALDSLCL